MRSFFENDPLFQGFFSDPYDAFRWPTLSQGQPMTTTGDQTFSWTPRCDVTETENEIKISGEFPGVPKEDIKITVDENTNVLKLEAEMKRETEEDDPNKKWHKQERRYGFFRRAFQLPKGVESDKITAAVENGILTVTVPAPKPAIEGPKKIQVK